MRIVADTNTALSGLLWQGPPRRLIDLARERALTLCTSTALLAELAEVIGRAKFSARVHDSGLAAADLVQDYAHLAEIAEPAPLTEPVSRDPDDDLVLATALGAEASLIVTGDRDLLTLGAFRDIPILAAADIGR
ncbi:MAG: putative toxin-antitoxin system toxin component, PIN family [Pseudomonadales bacterium]|nr:putative toxin-antitoxin system toxin component, PIN family [Pseudomonadales bacterium]